MSCRTILTLVNLALVNLALVNPVLSLSGSLAFAQSPGQPANVPPTLLEDIAVGSRILAEFGVVDALAMSAHAIRTIPPIS